MGELLFVYRKPLARRVVPKKANADDEKITPSGIVEMRSGNCKLQHRGRSFKNERHKQFISYEMELQIPHRICAEISAQSILWRETQRDRKNTEAAMRMEKGENCRGRSVSRPCAYAPRDTAQNLGFELRRILKGKKFANDLRTIPKSKV